MHEQLLTVKAPEKPPTPPPTATGAEEADLSPEQARKLIREDMRNLMKKVDSGKPLTVSELARMQARADGAPAESGKTWAKDQVELAAILGVTRQTINRWRKKGAPAPESNGRLNVPAWKEWSIANGGGTAEERTGLSRQQEEARRVLLMNQRLEVQIGIMRGDYIKVADAMGHIRTMVAEARRVGESMPASLAPQVVGLSVSEAEKRLRAWWDEYCLAIHTGTPSAVRG
jgi:hypothetical protein